MRERVAKSLFSLAVGLGLFLSTAAAADFQKSYTIGAGGQIRSQYIRQHRRFRVMTATASW